MMSLPFGLFTQVSGLGPLGPLVVRCSVCMCVCEWLVFTLWLIYFGFCDNEKHEICRSRIPYVWIVSPKLKPVVPPQVWLCSLHGNNVNNCMYSNEMIISFKRASAPRLDEFFIFIFIDLIKREKSQTNDETTKMSLSERGGENDLCKRWNSGQSVHPRLPTRSKKLNQRRIGV